jgi:two-component system chemotaxis response regulator CheY
MYPIDSLWENKRALLNIQTAIQELFQTKYGLTFTPKEPTCNLLAAPTLFYTHNIVRYTLAKASVAHVLGSTSQTFRTELFDLLKTSPTPPTEASVVDTDLGQMLFKALEVELKANQVVYDPKSCVVVPEKALFGWATTESTQVVKFPFTTPKGELTFEFPISDAAYQDHKTIESFGYSQKGRFLVVDDSMTSRKLSRHCLAMAGYVNIEESVDGQAALAKIVSTHPPFDLVVADWHMPNMSGLDLLRNVRQDPQYKSTPIILATGERNATEVTNAIKLGVSGYVVKPIEAETLFRAIKKTAPSAAKQTAFDPTIKKAS